jgi:hypothetical protein
MIVLIDQDNGIIKLYTDKGLETFELDEVDDLVKLIGKKKVQWITNFVEASGPQILETVNGLIAQGAGQQSGFDNMDSQTFYLQSNKNGILHIQDVNITFEGPGDCRLLDEEIYQCIQESAVLRALLRDKVVSIVDYATMKKASRKQQRQKSKFQKLRQSSKDKDLDSIIIQSDRPGSALDLAAGMFSNDRDVVSSDITDSIINDPTANMSEAEMAEALRRGEIEL